MEGQRERERGREKERERERAREKERERQKGGEKKGQKGEKGGGESTQAGGGERKLHSKRGAPGATVATPPVRLSAAKPHPTPPYLGRPQKGKGKEGRAGNQNLALMFTPKTKTRFGGRLRRIELNSKNTS